MIQKQRYWIVIFTVIVSLFLFSAIGNADFGDFAGDSDYGDSWDSGWDSDDNDWDWDDDDDRDWDDDDDPPGWFSAYSSNESSSSGSSGASDTPIYMVIGIIVAGIIPTVIIITLIRKIVKKKSRKRAIIPGAVPTAAASLHAMADYRNVDSGFSAEALCEQISNRYVQFQNAWQGKDLSALRPYLTDAFYAQMARQVEQYRKAHQTNHVERIAVLGVELLGWRQSGSVDEIVARLRTRIVDYVTADDTGEVIRGSNTAEKFMEYEWTLVRKTGIITGLNDGVTVHNCPNCGAVLNINQTAKCEFCGSVITVDAHEWAVSGIKGLSQRTAR